MKLPKFGPFSLFVAIALWIALISVQTHEQIQMTLDGSIVATRYACGTDGYSASASKLRFFAFTLLTCISLAYLMLMRLLMDRSRRSTRFLFFLGTTILCLLQLPFLISATTLLIQYIRVEGVTPMRIGGLVYAVVSLAVLFAICIWAFLQCREKKDELSFQCPACKQRFHITKYLSAHDSTWRGQDYFWTGVGCPAGCAWVYLEFRGSSVAIGTADGFPCPTLIVHEEKPVRLLGLKWRPEKNGIRIKRGLRTWFYSAR